MNCEQAEQRMLLRDSGELGIGGRWRLRRHLATCARCRATEASVRALTAAARNWSAGEPSDRALDAVRQLVQTAPDRRDDIVVAPAIRPSWKAAWACATVLLALGAALWWRGTADRSDAPAPVADTTPDAREGALAWDNGLDAELDALDSLVTTAWDEGVVAARTGATLEESGEDELARELLELQGYTI